MESRNEIHSALETPRKRNAWWTNRYSSITARPLFVTGVPKVPGWTTRISYITAFPWYLVLLRFHHFLDSYSRFIGDDYLSDELSTFPYTFDDESSVWWLIHLFQEKFFMARLIEFLLFCLMFYDLGVIALERELADGRSEGPWEREFVTFGTFLSTGQVYSLQLFI